MAAHARIRARHGPRPGSKHGVFTGKPGVLSTDFIANLLDMGTQRTPTGDIYEGKDHKTGRPKWAARRADVVFDAALRRFTIDGWRPSPSAYVVHWPRSCRDPEY